MRKTTWGMGYCASGMCPGGVKGGRLCCRASHSTLSKAMYGRRMWRSCQRSFFSFWIWAQRQSKYWRGDKIERKAWEWPEKEIISFRGTFFNKILEYNNHPSLSYLLLWVWLLCCPYLQHWYMRLYSPPWKIMCGGLGARQIKRTWQNHRENKWQAWHPYLR